MQKTADRLVARMPIAATTLALCAASVLIVFALAGGLAVATGWDVFAGGLATTTLVAWFLDTRWIALGIPFAAGLGTLYAATLALAADVPGVLGYTFLALGSALILCVVHSYRRSRAAWSFLSALCVVYPITLLFGAPRIANVTGASLPVSMIPAGVVAGAVVALSMQRADFLGAPAPTPASPDARARGRYAAAFGLVAIVAGLLGTVQDMQLILRGGVVLVAAGLLVLSWGFVQLSRPLAA
ncbi:MAG TPA: hypothetical protein VGM88_23855 [Kofleriaceae bacterium]